MAKKAAKSKPVGPPPNIQFIGRVERKGELMPAEAPAFINLSNRTIHLPADQSKPFYHDDAGLLIRTFPNLYKIPVSKGGAK